MVITNFVLFLMTYFWLKNFYAHICQETNLLATQLLCNQHLNRFHADFYLLSQQNHILFCPICFLLNQWKPKEFFVAFYIICLPIMGCVWTMFLLFTVHIEEANIQLILNRSVNCVFFGGLRIFAQTKYFNNWSENYCVKVWLSSPAQLSNFS